MVWACPTASSMTYYQIYEQAAYMNNLMMGFVTNTSACYQNYYTGTGAVSRIDYRWNTPTNSNYGTSGIRVLRDDVQYDNVVAYTDTSAVWQLWNGQIYVRNNEERQRRESLQRVQLEQRQAERRVADQRAESLLRMFLDNRQKKQYEEHRYFEVLTRDTKRRYRLNRKWAGNVEVFDEHDRLVETLCIHPNVEVPFGDHLLAQKLMLETNEEQFRSTANITRRTPVRQAA